MSSLDPELICLTDEEIHEGPVDKRLASELLSGSNEDGPAAPTDALSYTGQEWIDIANYIDGAYSAKDKERIKADILINTFKPIQTETGKDGRRFQSSWIDRFSWLTYSSQYKGAFCKFCVVFKQADSAHNQEFVKKPFTDFKNALGKKRGSLTKHSDSNEHFSAVEKGQGFLATVNDNERSILRSVSRIPQKVIDRNTSVMLSIIDVIYTLSVKGIALRGSWNANSNAEDGNFTYFLKWIAKRDETLDKHLSSGPKNARYISPTTQNEVIQSLGAVVLGDLVQEINASPFISIMADETADVSTVEQLALCIRYLKQSAPGVKEICESFLGFLQLQNTTAKTITSAILDELTRVGIDQSKIVGQGYDGASTMSGSKGGVQALISQQITSCKYFVHCKSHCLNLAIVASCKDVLEVRNFMDRFGSLTWYFHASPKRKGILTGHLQQQSGQLLADVTTAELLDEGGLIESSVKRFSLPTLSDTRWLSRIDSISVLLGRYSDIYTALIAVRDQSSGSSSSDAQSYLLTLESFSFIIAAVLSEHVLAFTRPLSVLLQGRDQDLLSAYDESQQVISVLTGQRSDEVFQKLYSRAVATASKIDIGPSKPRACSKSLHRYSLGADTRVDDFFRITVYFPFLDHVLSHLGTRFPKSQRSLYCVSSLLPPVKVSDELADQLQAEFKEFLPQPDSMDQELIRWSTRMAAANEKASLIDVINNTEPLLFPNISTVLNLLASLPVGSCSCERSFSALRRLKTWLRSSMSSDRLSSLAILHILRSEKYVSQLDLKRVLEHWDAAGTRRIKMAL